MTCHLSTPIIIKHHKYMKTYHKYMNTYQIYEHASQIYEHGPQKLKEESIDKGQIERRRLIELCSLPHWPIAIISKSSKIETMASRKNLKSKQAKMIRYMFFLTLRTETLHIQDSRTPVLAFAFILQGNSNLARQQTK